MASAVEPMLQCSVFDQLPKMFLIDVQIPKGIGMGAPQKIKADPLAAHLSVALLCPPKKSQGIPLCFGFGSNSLVLQAVRFQDHGKAIRSLRFYRPLLNQRSF
jgi:hypothetical protein